MDFIGNDYDAVVVGHETLRRVLQRVPNTLVHLRRRTQERTDVGFEDACAVPLVPKSERFARDYRQGIVVIRSLARYVNLSDADRTPSTMPDKICCRTW